MNLNSCRPRSSIAEAVAILLIGCSVGLTATITDPASRSGVWEATETIDGASVHFLFNVVLATNDTEQVGTFGIRGITARLSSTLTSTSAPLQDDLLDPICDVHDDEIQISDDQMSSSCRESSKWWDEIVVKFGWKGESVTVLLIGKKRELSIFFRRIPIDRASPLDGDWTGTTEPISRRSVLHFRTDLYGSHILTFDVWGSGQGCWGCMTGFGLDENNVTFSNMASISHSAFVGKLSPDKQRITGLYSGGEFAGRTFVRMKQ